jgi:sodium transport system permease protein
MNWQQVWTIFAKETLDNIRDRRTLLSSFSLSVLSPLLFVGLMVFILDRAVGASDAKPEAQLIGGEHAPTLVAWLRSQGATLTEVKIFEPRLAVIAGDSDLIMVVPADFADGFNDGTSHVQLIHDSSKFGDASRHYNQLRAYIGGYSRLLGRMRLQVRGIDARIVDPINIQTLDTASPGARALSVLASFPYLLVLVIFMGGFYLAIDTTAGERDHGSLEPLLTQPVARFALVLGKLGATSAFAFIALGVFLIIFAVAVPFVPFHRIGMSLTFGPGKLAAILLLCLPLIMLAAALLTVVAGFAKSFKEAQTYLSVVIFIPTLPLIITGILGVDPSTPLMLIPSLSQSLLVSELLSDGELQWLWVCISAITTLGLALLFYLLAVRLYQSERLLV